MPSQLLEFALAKRREFFLANITGVLVGLSLGIPLAVVGGDRDILNASAMFNLLKTFAWVIGASMLISIASASSYSPGHRKESGKK